MAVVVQFLVRKFIDSLAEEGASELPFGADFYDMRTELEKVAISSTNVDELRECMYELNNLLSQCRTLTDRPNTSSCFFSPSKAWNSNKVKKRVAAMKHRVMQCAQNDPGGDAAALQEGSTTAGFSRWTTSWPEQSMIHGFDQQLAELEYKAFSDCIPGRLTGVGIVGMSGIGKTALAQLVFNSPQARGRFFPRIWVCMSRTARVAKDVRKEVLQSILMALGLEEEVILAIDCGGTNLGDLELAVYEQLKGKRYLIVFDDVWNIDDWYADVAGAWPGSDQLSNCLACSLPKERGGLVVVTSRLEQAAEMMVGKSSVYRVQPLADRESSWAIFMDALSKERGAIDLTAVSSMKEEILDTCGGLPSMAKAMAYIFANSLLTCSQELSLSGEIVK